MTVKGTHGTYAMLAARHPQPVPKYTTAQQLDRLHKNLVVTLGGGWSVSETVGLICEPLARRITAAPNPGRFLRSLETPAASHLVNYPRSTAPGVDDVSLAVHGLVHVVVGLLAERGAQRKTAHLEGSTRARSIQAVIDLTQRPELPEITREDVVSGTWAARLIMLTEPHSGELADLLGRARTVDLSDRVVAALREVDNAAGDLSRRLDRDEVARAERAARKKAPARTEANMTRAELAELGVIV